MMTAAMAILAAGCAKEIDTVNPAGEDVVFEASLSETDADAKAVLIPGKAASKVEWVKGDLVGVYAGTSYYEYKADKSGASSTLSPVGASSTASEYYAVYPYDAAATLAGGVITTTLPSEQTPALESFSYHLAVAHSESLTLNFKNVCGLFAADVTEPGVTKIEIKGNNNEILAGKVAITVADTPSWTAVEGVKTVSISAPQGKTLQVGTYYMAVLPQEFAGGVTVTAYYKDGTTLVKNVTDKVIVAASGLLGGKIATGEWKIEHLLTGIGNNPEDIVLAPDGNFWFTTRGTTQKIWKFDVATKAYSAVAAFTGSTHYPWGAAFDKDGLFWVVAKGTGKLYTCTATGTLSEYVINNAPATQMKHLMKVQVDDNGNIFMLERGDSNVADKIHVIKGNEIVKSYTLPTANKTYGYEYMCFNQDKTKMFLFGNDTGDIQLMDLSDGTMQKVAGKGANHSSAANYTDGTPGNPMTAAVRQVEGAICAADGTLYFTDTIGKTIRMFVPDANGDYSKGTIRTIAGKPYDATVLNYPNGLALSADGKTLYFADNGGKIGKVYYQKYE